MLLLGLEASTASGGAALLEIDDLARPEAGRLLGAASFTSSSLHAQRLLPTVDWLLERTGRKIGEVEAVAVARGPGSFTGLRIALSAAKGLAYATGAAVVVVSTLEALALRAGSALPAGTVVVALLDARQGEVYAGVFRVAGGGRAGGGEAEGSEALTAGGGAGDAYPLPRLERVREDYAGPLEPLLEMLRGDAEDADGDGGLAPLAFAGDGAWRVAPRLAELLGERFRRAPVLRSLPSAEEVAWLGAMRLARGERDEVFALAPNYLRRSYMQK